MSIKNIQNYVFDLGKAPHHYKRYSALSSTERKCLLVVIKSDLTKKDHTYLARHGKELGTLEDKLLKLKNGQLTSTKSPNYSAGISRAIQNFWGQRASSKKVAAQINSTSLARAKREGIGGYKAKWDNEVRTLKIDPFATEKKSYTVLTELMNFTSNEADTKRVGIIDSSSVNARGASITQVFNINAASGYAEVEKAYVDILDKERFHLANINKYESIFKLYYLRHQAGTRFFDKKTSSSTWTYEQGFAKFKADYDAAKTEKKRDEILESGSYLVASYYAMRPALLNQYRSIQAEAQKNS